ncbi:trypco2 family protein [Streptomyces sp. CoT10]|uniref:trypco2 family protein n=1 Tax=Streptomyces sp. CoT10 TaxID=2875762 RepID=UPI001CD1A978|nr:trypco2 family protein [Streptomyces sp. CoT10]
MAASGHDGDEGIGLAAALGAIRRELAQAMSAAQAEGGPVRLSVSSLELELQTTLSQSGGVNGGIRVHVISAGAQRSEGRSDVQTLRLQLDATTLDNKPVPAGDTVSRRPR